MTPKERKKNMKLVRNSKVPKKKKKKRRTSNTRREK